MILESLIKYLEFNVSHSSQFVDMIIIKLNQVNNTGRIELIIGPKHITLSLLINIHNDVVCNFKNKA